MNNCNRLLPICRRFSGTLVPKRSFFYRRCIPSNIMERQLAEMDRQFARLEREMNAVFRDWNATGGRLFSPKTRPFFFEPLATTQTVNRGFPTIETETSAATETGKPGKYTVKIDVGEGFTPDDIKVSLKDRLLTVQAKLEKKSEDSNSRIYQEVSRSFTLPENVNPEEVKSLFTPDGILAFEAPLPEVDEVRPKEIPIAIESKG